MRLDGWRVDGFGGLADWQVEALAEHELIVVCGPNESGKSTLREFIATAYFGFSPAQRELHPFAPVTAGSAARCSSSTARANASRSSASCDRHRGAACTAPPPTRTSPTARCRRSPASPGPSTSICTRSASTSCCGSTRARGSRSRTGCSPGRPWRSSARPPTSGARSTSRPPRSGAPTGAASPRRGACAMRISGLRALERDAAAARRRLDDIDGELAARARARGGAAPHRHGAGRPPAPAHRSRAGAGRLARRRAAPGRGRRHPAPRRRLPGRSRRRRRPAPGRGGRRRACRHDRTPPGRPAAGAGRRAGRGAGAGRARGRAARAGGRGVGRGRPARGHRSRRGGAARPSRRGRPQGRRGARPAAPARRPRRPRRRPLRRSPRRGHGGGGTGAALALLRGRGGRRGLRRCSPSPVSAAARSRPWPRWRWRAWPPCWPALPARAGPGRAPRRRSVRWPSRRPGWRCPTRAYRPTSTISARQPPTRTPPPPSCTACAPSRPRARARLAEALGQLGLPSATQALQAVDDALIRVAEARRAAEQLAGRDRRRRAPRGRLRGRRRAVATRCSSSSRPCGPATASMPPSRPCSRRGGCAPPPTNACAAPTPPSATWPPSRPRRPSWSAAERRWCSTTPRSRASTRSAPPMPPPSRSCSTAAARCWPSGTGSPRCRASPTLPARRPCTRSTCTRPSTAATGWRWPRRCSSTPSGGSASSTARASFTPRAATWPPSRAVATTAS